MAPPYQYDDEDPPPRSRRSRRDPSPDDSPSPPAPKQRRKPTFQDEPEPSARSRPKPSGRSADVNDKSDGGDVDGWWVTHRNGKREFITDNDPRAADIKSKAGANSAGASAGSGGRSKRKDDDDYETDRRRPPRDRDGRDRRDDYDSDDGDARRRPRKARGVDDDDLVLPSRDRSKETKKPNLPAAAALGGGAAAGAAVGGTAGPAAHAAAKQLERDSDDEKPGPVKSSARDPRSRVEDDLYRERRDPKRRDYNTDDEAPRPRRRRDPDEDEYAGAGRSSGRRGEGASRTGDRPRRRYDDDDDDDYPPRRSEPKGVQRSQSARYPSGRDRDRDRELDRGLDREYDRRGLGGGKPRNEREKRGKEKDKQDWKKQAGALFMSQAMPVIKREGMKMLQKEMAGRFG